MANCRECYLVWLLASQLSQQRALDVILFLKFLILLVCSLFIRKVFKRFTANYSGMYK